MKTMYILLQTKPFQIKLKIIEMSSAGWKVLEDDHRLEEHYGESVDTQVVERKRRLTSGSKTKTYRRYIQDISSFLWNEATAAEEDLKFEHKEVVCITLGRDTTKARGRMSSLLKSHQPRQC